MPDQPLPTILIVDDVPENIRLLGNLLKDQGRIRVATRSTDVMAMALAEPPDLVLLDVVMPDMDGYAVVMALKSCPATADIPVIFVTGQLDETDEMRGLELGAIDYITRPIVPSIARARIRNHLALRQATLALQRANTELLRLATTDVLTGAFNRRHFFDQGERELARLRRTHAEASVLMVDIDRFKNINDTHGHDIGDKAIIATATTAQRALRKEDVFGRIGGEEFAAILPDTGLKQSILVAERLREQVAAIRVPAGAAMVAFTVSIGIAALAPEIETCAVALKAADEALYQAKTSGRNRVVVYQTGGDAAPRA